MAQEGPRRYIRRPDRPVTAVRLALETDGLVYRKWGGEQRAKAGDWIVDNDGDVYTVDADVFARTYRSTGPGAYVKTTPIWAERAQNAGSVKTKEGATHYDAGDYLVSNNSEGTDQYAIEAGKFETMFVEDAARDLPDPRQQTMANLLPIFAVAWQRLAKELLLVE